jgi:hypothetical protein
MISTATHPSIVSWPVDLLYTTGCEKHLLMTSATDSETHLKFSTASCLP